MRYRPEQPQTLKPQFWSPSGVHIRKSSAAVSRADVPELMSPDALPPLPKGKPPSVATKKKDQPMTQEILLSLTKLFPEGEESCLGLASREVGAAMKAVEAT